MILLNILFGVASISQAAVNVLAPVEDLFIPNGFDHNDTTEVVVSGYLPDPCHSRPEISVQRSGRTFEVRVTTQRQSGSSFVCPAVVVPFMESVRLGKLASGDYSINVNSVRHLAPIQGKLHINVATTEEVDNHIYALVEYVEKDLINRHFFINGYNYSDCLELDRVEMIDNGKDTISVMPIMRKIRDACPRKMTPFRYEIKPDFSKVNSDKVLLHVRTADGRAVNSLLDFTAVIPNY